MPSISANGNSWTQMLGALGPGWAIARTNGRAVISGIKTHRTRLAGISAQELTPEFLEGSDLNSLPNPPHRVKVKVQIVQCVKGRGCHLTRHEKIPQVGPRVPPAGRARAIRIGWPLVLRVPGILDGNRPV